MLQSIIRFLYYCWEIILVIGAIVGVVSFLCSSEFSGKIFKYIIGTVVLFLICSGLVAIGYTEVPSVVNLSLDNALQVLYGDDLDVDIDSGNIDISAMTVCNQIPVAGTVVAKGTRVYLEYTESQSVPRPPQTDPETDDNMNEQDLSSSLEVSEPTIPDVVDLTTLTPYYTKTEDLYVSQQIVDTLGNVYATGLQSWWCHSEPQSNTYYINGNYSLLTATVVVNEMSKGSKELASIYIYGDDNCLYSVDVTSDQKPFDISIDITGVTDLTIDMFGRGYIGFDSMDATLCNVMLHR